MTHNKDKKINNTFFPPHQIKKFNQCTEVRFASFLSGGFTTMAVMNPPEKKLKKRTSVHWGPTS